jgi:hypothetical protein
MKQDNQSDGSTSNASNNKPSRFRLRWIFVAGGVLLVALLFISIYLPNLTERVKFFTVNALSLFVLVAIVVQAYIYRGQWKAMQESLIETRNLIKQNERAVKAAEHTADLTDKFSRINSRAYVFIDKAALDAPISSGKFPLPKIVLKNSGRSPAYSHRVRINNAFLAGEAVEKAKKGIMPDLGRVNEKGLGIIGAGQLIFLHWTRGIWKTSEDEQLAITGISTYYVWGIIRYSDIFGDEHSSKFSLYARNTKVTELTYGMFGNDFEDEETGKVEGKPDREKAN